MEAKLTGKQPIGRNITLELLRLSSELNISRPLGVAPKDLFLARYKYGHPNSVLTEWVKHVLPSTIIDRKRSAVNRTIIVQSGSLRFDVVSATLNIAAVPFLTFCPSSKGGSTAMTS